MAQGLFGPIKPDGGRRSSAAFTGMRQNQAGKNLGQARRPFVQ